MKSLFYGNFNLLGKLIVEGTALVGYGGSEFAFLFEFGYLESRLAVLVDLGGEGFLLDFEDNLGVLHCLSPVVL